MARPQHAVTPRNRQLVEILAGHGMPQGEIALAIGIDPKTLRARYRAELDRGIASANARVLVTAFKMATSGKSAAMTIFWLKCRLGWKERQVIEYENRDLHEYTDEELNAIIARDMPEEELAVLVERFRERVARHAQDRSVHESSSRGSMLEPQRGDSSRKRV